MKWLFLVNDALFLSEFFGKLSNEIIQKGDDCLVVFSSKIAEYHKKQFFPNGAKFVSLVDWCVANYKEDKEEFFGLSWKDFFPVFDRCSMLNFDYNKALNLVLQNAKFLEFIFEKEKPNIVISESPPGIFHEIAFRFCEKNNIPYLALEDSKFQDRIDIYEERCVCLKCQNDFSLTNEKNLSADDKRFAQDFIKKLTTHELITDKLDYEKIYLNHYEIAKHYLKRIKEETIILLRYLVKRKNFKKFDHESEQIFKKSFVAPLKMEARKLKIFLQRRFFPKINLEKEKFFLFPLQFQPESSTSVYATYYCDQLNTAKNVAFALPLPYKLYVKEHPASVGRRADDFYKKLKAIPNIVLVPPEENVQNLIKNSAGVIILTGTIGMEASLMGKPVYVLGTVNYSHHPFCRKVGSIEDLKNKIEKDLIERPDLRDLQNINNRFIFSYFENTIKGSIYLANTGEDKNDYELIYNNLKNHKYAT